MASSIAVTEGVYYMIHNVILLFLPRFGSSVGTFGGGNTAGRVGDEMVCVSWRNRDPVRANRTLDASFLDGYRMRRRGQESVWVERFNSHLWAYLRG